MKYLNGDKVKDSNGQEWTVWATQMVTTTLGKARETCLLYSSSGDVKTCMASLLQPTEETQTV